MSVITSHRPVEAVVSMWKSSCNAAAPSRNISRCLQLSRLAFHCPDRTSLPCYRQKLHRAKDRCGALSRNLPLGRPDLGGEAGFESLRVLFGDNWLAGGLAVLQQRERGRKNVGVSPDFPSDVDRCAVIPCFRSLKEGQPLF